MHMYNNVHLSMLKVRKVKFSNVDNKIWICTSNVYKITMATTSDCHVCTLIIFEIIELFDNRT